MKVKNIGKRAAFLCTVYVKPGEVGEIPDRHQRAAEMAILEGMVHFELVTEPEPEPEPEPEKPVVDRKRRRRRRGGE